METVKSKSELIKDMQAIAVDVEAKKQEIELLSKVIDNLFANIIELEKKYYEIAEQIQKN